MAARKWFRSLRFDVEGGRNGGAMMETETGVRYHRQLLVVLGRVADGSNRWTRQRSDECRVGSITGWMNVGSEEVGFMYVYNIYKTEGMKKVKMKVSDFGNCVIRGEKSSEVKNLRKRLSVRLGRRTSEVSRK
jgi:hypothetical protein